MKNKIRLELAALSENVAFARVVAAAFITPLDPSVAEISDIKTAVSEAVTNAIIHGYNSDAGAFVSLSMEMDKRELTIEVTDSGVGMENVGAAREPLFTTKPEMERSGLGFTVMESFMDTVEVTSRPNEGTTVKMLKKLAGGR